MKNFRSLFVLLIIIILSGCDSKQVSKTEVTSEPSNYSTNKEKENNEIEIAAEHLTTYLNLENNSLIKFINYSVNGKYIEFEYDYDTYAVNIKDHSVLEWTMNPEDPLGGASYEYYQATCGFDGIITKRYEKVYNKHFVSKDGLKKVNEASSYIFWLPEMEETNDVNVKINQKLKQYNKDLIDKYDSMAKKHLDDDEVLKSIKENDCIAAADVYYFDIRYYVKKYDDEIITFLISGYDFDTWEETLSFSTKTGELIK